MYVTGCLRPVISEVTKEDTSASTLKLNLSLGVCIGSQALLGNSHKVEPHPQRI